MRRGILLASAAAFALSGCGYENGWETDAAAITVAVGSVSRTYADSESMPLAYRLATWNGGESWSIKIKWGSNHLLARNCPYEITYKGDAD